MLLAASLEITSARRPLNRGWQPDHTPDIPLLDGQDGAHVPAIGLGTYDLRGAAGTDSVRTVIDAGYRLIDSAFNSDNEGAVGHAVRDSAVRDQLVLTTKLPAGTTATTWRCGRWRRACSAAAWAAWTWC